MSDVPVTTLRLPSVPDAHEGMFLVLDCSRGYIHDSRHVHNAPPDVSNRDDHEGNSTGSVLSVVAPTPVRPVAFLQDYGYHQSQAMSSNETGIGVDFVENTRNVPQYTTLLSPESRFLLYDMPLPNPDDFEYQQMQEGNNVAGPDYLYFPTTTPNESHHYHAGQPSFAPQYDASTYATSLNMGNYVAAQPIYDQYFAPPLPDQTHYPNVAEPNGSVWFPNAQNVNHEHGPLPNNTISPYSSVPTMGEGLFVPPWQPTGQGHEQLQQGFAG